MIDGIRQKPIDDIKNEPVALHEREVQFVPVPQQAHRMQENPFLTKKHTKKAPFVEEHLRRSSRLGLFLVVLGASVFLAIGVITINYFSSATINVIPITRSALVGNEFTATKNANEGDLTLQFLNLNEEKTKEVKGTIEQNIQKKASGKATIYNFYSGTPQRLIKNTRLESPDHKIFRINDSVVVPGAKMVGGKVSVPGSVVVSIFADMPGKEYNIGLSDFVIPGFEGDPKYSKFTARSNAEAPLSGGFSGITEVPSPGDLLQAKNDLKEELKKTVIEKATSQTPKDSSFFPGSIVLRFEERPEELTVGENEKITISAKASIFFFDTETLTKKIVEATLPKYLGSALAISNLQAISFTFVDEVTNVVITDLTKIRFHLTGEAVFVGKIDTEKLSANLAGKNKTDFTKIIFGQNNIERANVSMFPVWKNIFPSDPKKIFVKIISE